MTENGFREETGLTVPRHSTMNIANILHCF